MSSKVIPLRRSTASAEEGTRRPKAIPRVLSHTPGMSKEALAEACREQERVIAQYEPRLTAMVAKTITDKLPSIEAWVGAIFTTEDEDDAGVLVEITPREQAIDATKMWGSIEKGLRAPPLADRLDVVVEAQLVVGLVSIDLEPALPVTRRQAEAVNLPTHLLFAKGEAFASVGDEPSTYESLLAAYTEHKRLVDEHSDELLEKLREASVKSPLDECAGVILALGPDGNAISVVRREQAMKLVADKPFLERKLTREPSTDELDDGREILAFPIVVWAKGHVSVQMRDVVHVV
jgi:hypothetical protein